MDSLDSKYFRNEQKQKEILNLRKWIAWIANSLEMSQKKRDS